MSLRELQEELRALAEQASRTEGTPLVLDLSSRKVDSPHVSGG